VKNVTWTQLLASNEVQRHKTSKKELDKLRAVIARDFAGRAVDRQDPSLIEVNSGERRLAKTLATCA
jgi:hypothetical protein